MSNEIEKHESDEKILSVKEVKAQIQVIQEIMSGVKQNGQHYGVIPGCGSKPTLLKAGAEKLAFTFRLKIKPEVEITEIEGGHRNYRITTEISDRHGAFIGSGIGEASTTEEKYMWRGAVCDEEYEATLETEKRIKFKRSYGKIEKIKQVKTNPADIYNTVLKPAKKRSMVDGILTVLAASDIFTQDIEDLTDDAIEKPKPSKSDSVQEKVEGEKKQESQPPQTPAGQTTPSTPPETPKPKLKASQLLHLLKTCKNAASFNRAWNENYSQYYTEEEKNNLLEWKEK